MPLGPVLKTMPSLAPAKVADSMKPCTRKSFCSPFVCVLEASLALGPVSTGAAGAAAASAAFFAASTSARILSATCAAAATVVGAGAEELLAASCCCCCPPSPLPSPLPSLPLPLPLLPLLPAMGLSSIQGSWKFSSSSSRSRASPIIRSFLALTRSICCWLFSVLSYLKPLPPKPPQRFFFCAWPVFTAAWWSSASFFSFWGTSWPHCRRASTMSCARSASSGWTKV
mmetsp:Transcript_31430/g.93355  ORF Transcript_31430/g.93355 Transcript_31430/m.93355 type:complete len:228 (+) Transcript_31430:959-1642(+)